MTKPLDRTDVGKLLSIATLRLDGNGTAKNSLVPANPTAVAIGNDSNVVDSKQTVEIDKSALEDLLMTVAELKEENKRKAKSSYVPSPDQDYYAPPAPVDVRKSISPESFKKPVD